MRQEQIKDFTLRISNANRSDLVVIKFDVFGAYANEALNAYQAGDYDTWSAELKRAILVIRSFKNSLDFKYELASNLYSVYHYCEKLCYKALSLRDKEKLKEALRLMDRLAGAFREIAGSDDSPVLMGNSQQVVAGMTYGPGSLNEGLLTQESNRGFYA